MEKLLIAIKKIICVSLGCILLLGNISVCAETYKSFQSHSGQGKDTMVAQKDVYTHRFHIDGNTLGINNFTLLKDQCVSNGSLYLLDSGASSIYIIGTDYKYAGQINSIVDNGKIISLETAEGIYVNNNGTIFIADPEKQCVFVIDEKGNVIHKIVKPKSSIIPNDLEFKAKKIIQDKDGYIFVLCSGVYYGAMVFDSNYEFCGFFGANQTSVDIVDAVKGFFLNIFKTDMQRQYSIRSLPYEFDDIYEYNGFVYTATASAKNSKGQLRKISYNGINILKNNGASADNYNFGIDETITLIDKKPVNQEFVSIAIDENGLIYGLDQTYGRVFVYDDSCNLITAFGGGMGLGEQLGTFIKASEISVFGSDILVLDSEKNLICVFGLTDFGKLLYKTQKIYKTGDYEAAYPLWKQILSEDAYNQMSYSGMADYYILKGDYKTALSLAKKGCNRDLYERAFEQVRLNFLSDNFILISVVLILLITSLIIYLLYRKKNYKNCEKSDNILKMFIRAPWKPIQTALHIKNISKNDKKRINIYTIVAIGIFFIYFIFKVLETTAGGFMYVSYDVDKYNSALIFISTFGLLLLWSIVNWGLCTLFEGKGTYREIVIVTGVAFIPQIIYSAFFIVASHVLIYNEQPIITGVYTICLIITVIVLLVELSVIHEYSFFRSIGMSLVTIIGMLAVSFLLLLSLTLFKDVIAFIGSIFKEIAYRGN